MCTIIRGNQSADSIARHNGLKKPSCRCKITQSLRKSKTKPIYEVDRDREEWYKDPKLKEAMRVIEVTTTGCS